MWEHTNFAFIKTVLQAGVTAKKQLGFFSEIRSAFRPKQTVPLHVLMASGVAALNLHSAKEDKTDA